MSSPAQTEIDNLLHQLAQTHLAPFAIIDLTARLQKLLLARYDDEHPLCDQPSFPHSEHFARAVRVQKAVTGGIGAYEMYYVNDYNVSPELARAAIRYILEEQS